MLLWEYIQDWNKPIMPCVRETFLIRKTSVWKEITSTRIEYFLSIGDAFYWLVMHKPIGCFICTTQHSNSNYGKIF